MIRALAGRGLARLALLVAPAAFAVLGGAGPAAAADCPAVSFLSHGDSVYRAYFIPAGVDLPVGSALEGDGVADVPGGDDNCARKRLETAVRAFSGISPEIAVSAAERPRLAFVLGNKCVGFVGPDFWSCLKDPLELDGRAYVGAAYPRLPAPRKAVSVGEPVGTATLGGEPVTAVRIEGVDPAVAVGVEGQENVAYVAVGACPYERFDNRVALDDLRRCLSGPVWLVFAPPGALPGESVEARADRALATGTRVTVSLAPAVAGVGDILPQDRSAAVTVGTLTAGEEPTLVFDVPELDAGRYEAIATCETCASAHGGRSVFPAGLFIVGSGGSSTTRYVLYAVALGVVALLVTAMYFRRKRSAGGGLPRLPGGNS